ncbi:hypothetical protein BPOR_0228g00040 [Botrytis porri]|uniref:Uncharacterized protein n=1 Tax=Botrytis porri TaxID=87229 RepID=A0A4Z1KR27_9HELO|nr:hypothetical protein BPOR_0228g00040 [Botrytis porri]
MSYHRIKKEKEEQTQYGVSRQEPPPSNRSSNTQRNTDARAYQQPINDRRPTPLDSVYEGQMEAGEGFGWNRSEVTEMKYDPNWSQPSTGAYNTPSIDYGETSQQQQGDYLPQQLEQFDTSQTQSLASTSPHTYGSFAPEGSHFSHGSSAYSGNRLNGTRQPTDEAASPGLPVMMEELNHPQMDLMEGKIPYGFPDVWIPGTVYANNRWVSTPTTGEPDYGYLPMAKNPMKEFWQGVATDQEEEWFCRRWDYVDFLRLVYLTVTLNVVTIFNNASRSTQNRPPGFFTALGNRNKQVDVPLLRQFFQILNNQENPNRNDPLIRVIEWYKRKGMSLITTKRVLNGIPEAIYENFGLTFQQCNAQKWYFRFDSSHYLMAFQNHDGDINWRLLGPSGEDPKPVPGGSIPRPLAYDSLGPFPGLAHKPQAQPPVNQQSQSFVHEPAPPLEYQQPQPSGSQT